jgi:hypothetical protein
MHVRRDPDPRGAHPGFGSRLLFALSLWVSLATAIVCAVVPAGLPATRTVGSAFDPSTTIVALRSKPPVAKVAILRITGRDGLGGGDGGVALPAAAAPLPAPPAAERSVPAFPALATVVLPRAIDATLYARPPPVR